MVILLIIILSAICLFIKFHHSPECYDCGEGGWQKIDMGCDGKIVTKDDAELCIYQQNIAPKVLGNLNITQGYILIGESDFYNTPKRGGIKVFVYGRYALDEKGNIYMLNILG